MHHNNALRSSPTLIDTRSQQNKLIHLPESNYMPTPLQSPDTVSHSLYEVVSPTGTRGSIVHTFSIIPIRI
jgi:hypothetical protein